MAIVVDTCSLIMMAKNYLPLDESGKMAAFIKNSFLSKELLLLDVIHNETRWTAQGLVLDKMSFLNEKNLIISTVDLLPPAPKKFDNMVDKNFCVTRLRKELTDEEYIQQKSEFMKSGDAKILIYAWTQQYKKPELFECHIMTEETKNQNDGKLFKKLPILCDLISVKTITAVDYLHQNGFKIDHS